MSEDPAIYNHLPEKILYLTLKKKWFDMISSGEKLDEYRELKRYWILRFISQSFICDLNLKDWILYLIQKIQDGELTFKPYTHVVFSNGYSFIAPKIKFSIKGFDIGFGRSDWGALSSEQCFIIHLDKKIELRTNISV